MYGSQLYYRRLTKSMQSSSQSTCYSLVFLSLPPLCGSLIFIPVAFVSSLVWFTVSLYVQLVHKVFIITTTRIKGFAYSAEAFHLKHCNLAQII